MRHWIFLLPLALGAGASAREVSISLHSGQSELVLTNPSSISMNYDITCYTPDGSGNLLALTNQTLASKAKVTHTAGTPDSGKCTGNANPYATYTDANSKQYYFCDGSATYANANTLCGTGNSFCFPDISTTVFTCGCSTFWLKNDGDVQYAAPCAAFGAVSGGNQVAIGTFTGGQVKKTTATSPCSSFYYANEYAVASSRGAVCCSSPVAASVCRVKINTTNTAGHLASPSFMGGAAF